MANPDKPNGFKLVASLSGAPVSSLIRSIGVTDGTDIFKGDMISLASGLGAVSATNDATFLGVAVGFGKVDPATGNYASAYNPDNLTTLYYDDSASTHTEWRVFYIPVDQAIFEVQSDTDLDLLRGAACDLLVTTAGSTTTGISGQQIGASTNADFHVVDIPAYPDNDSTLANTRYHVTVTGAESIWV
jgi:hypothetical protein